jgi:hypothetical protein
MQLTDRARVEQLTGKIADLVNGVGPDVTHVEMICALLNAVAGITSEIPCPDCRLETAKHARAYLRGALEQALRDVATQPPHSAHRH